VSPLNYFLFVSCPSSGYATDITYEYGNIMIYLSAATKAFIQTVNFPFRFVLECPSNRNYTLGLHALYSARYLQNESHS